MDLKPIETIYNGNRFRSRLEARWALYFDLMCVQYQYEPEGFECDGERYLPDFYIQESDVYIEIKSIGALSIDNDEILDGREKAHKYNKCGDDIIHAGHGYLLLCGSPIEIVSHKPGAFAYCGDWDRFWDEDEFCLNAAYKADKFMSDYVIGASKEEAEIASYCRFEHGENADDYIKVYVENYYKNIKNKPKDRKKQLLCMLNQDNSDSELKVLIGVVCLHPEFLQDIGCTDAIEYGLENMFVESRYAHIMEGLIRCKHANKNMNIDEMLEHLTKGFFTKFDVALARECQKSRSVMSSEYSDFNHFVSMVDWFSDRHRNKSNSKSLEDVLKRYRMEVNHAEI